jgi:GNAT superfamily N-acetyltransferase
MPLAIRPARPDEAALLSDLALRSKAHWGYDEQFLAMCKDELSFEPSGVISRRTVVAELDGVALGLATLNGDPPIGELGMLFVAPEAIGTGVGGKLFRHVAATARRLRFHRLTIEADPNAEPFYLAMGAIRVGSVPSGSIPGRELPLLEFDLEL